MKLLLFIDYLLGVNTVRTLKLIEGTTNIYHPDNPNIIKTIIDNEDTAFFKKRSKLF